MQLEDVQQALQESGLPAEQAKGMLHLIDIKIEHDMKEVLNEIRNQNIELKRIEDKMDTRFNIIIWVLGILVALMVALKFFGK